MYCGNCGKEVNDNDLFCGNCGAKIDKTSKLNENKNIQADNKKVIKITLTKLILIVLAILLIFGISAGIIISINKKHTPLSKEDFINEDNIIISIQSDTGCIKLDNSLWLIGAKDVKINSNNHLVDLTTIEYPSYHYTFEYKYDEKNRIIDAVKHIEYDNTKYEYNYTIDYLDTSSQKINKIVRTVNLDEQEALNRMECPYAEIKYEYNANGDIIKITEFQYMNTPNNTDKYLFTEINYNFDYNIYVSNVVNMTSSTRMIQFSSNNGKGISYNNAYNTASTYKYKTTQKYDVSGNKEDIRVGKNAYEEILMELFQDNHYLLRRSEAEIVNYGTSYGSTTPYRYSKYIMYPSNVTIYDNDKKISETIYSYNDKNYLYSSGNVMDNSTYKDYFYMYNGDKMGVFTGTGTDNNLIYEITFEDNTIKKIEYVESNERDKLTQKYTSNTDVHSSKEDVNKTDVNSTKKYLMQIWGKDSEFLSREFYTFCSNYRRSY